MRIKFKAISVYIDNKKNLIAIPYGESKKYSLKALDIVFHINPPYDDEEIENFLLNAIDKSYSKIANDNNDIGVLEKFLKIKAYTKAVQNKKIVGFNWYKDIGYFIVPTDKIPKKGYVDMEDMAIKLGKEIKKGELAKAFKKAAELSTTY